MGRVPGDTWKSRRLDVFCDGVGRAGKRASFLLSACARAAKYSLCISPVVLFVWVEREARATLGGGDAAWGEFRSARQSARAIRLADARPGATVSPRLS